ncbi:MAG: hypothetical protein EA344_00370 [Alkalicoccus sp.]|nr:MAG: hypothetical protein EA344_00370 [Alkalicoccus sp.]
MTWKAYSLPAWTAHILSPPEEYKEEAAFHLQAFKKRRPPVPSFIADAGQEVTIITIRSFFKLPGWTSAR